MAPAAKTHALLRNIDAILDASPARATS